MLLLLATPEYNNLQSNITKVRVHLRNGVAEIFDQHQDLMGKVENNLIEIETNFENKLEKSLFVLQDAVFIVSNKGLDGNSETNETGVYIYAKKAAKVGKNIPTDELSEQYDTKKVLLDAELEKLNEKKSDSLNKVVTSKVLLLQDEVEFLRKAIVIAKDLKV
jgi:F0F1-type ATP synthase epsilon subunit